MVGGVSSFWISTALGVGVVVVFQNPIPTPSTIVWQTVTVSTGGAMLFYVASWVGGWRRYASYRWRMAALLGISLLGLWALYLLSATQTGRLATALLGGALMASTVSHWRRDHVGQIPPDALVERLGAIAAGSAAIVMLKLTELFFTVNSVVLAAVIGVVLVFWLIGVTGAGARISKAVALEWAIASALMVSAFAWFPIALGVRVAALLALALWLVRV